MTTAELRELDVWIAKELFGWDFSEKGWCMSALQHRQMNGFYYGFPPDSIQYKGCALPHRAPDYTTDPAAAMQVLEKCAAKIAVSARQQDGGKWCVWAVDDESYKPKELDGYAETLPLAICLFAKKLFSK